MREKHIIAFIFFSILLIACNSGSPVKPIEIECDNSITYDIKKILIIGNSITKNPPLIEKGWNGNWGMAASDSTKDYVHILMDSVKKYNPNALFKYTGKGVVFEKEYLTDDKTQSFKEFYDFKPDFIILRIGENVNDDVVQTTNFRQYFEDFALYFKSNDNTPVVCVSSFWTKPNTTSIMKEVSKKNKFRHIELHDLSQNKNNMALDKFDDYGVSIHPSDEGMKNIAIRIWDDIKFYFKGC